MFNVEIRVEKTIFCSGFFFRLSFPFHKDLNIFFISPFCRYNMHSKLSLSLRSIVLFFAFRFLCRVARHRHGKQPLFFVCCSGFAHIAQIRAVVAAVTVAWQQTNIFSLIISVFPFFSRCVRWGATRWTEGNWSKNPYFSYLFQLLWHDVQKEKK